MEGLGLMVSLHSGALEDLDQKPDSREDLAVGLEVVGVGCAVEHGICCTLVDERILERDRRAHSVPGERLAGLGGAGLARVWIDASTLKPLCVQSSMFLASRSFDPRGAERPARRPRCRRSRTSCRSTGTPRSSR